MRGSRLLVRSLVFSFLWVVVAASPSFAGADTDTPESPLQAATRARLRIHEAALHDAKLLRAPFAEASAAAKREALKRARAQLASDAKLLADATDGIPLAELNRMTALYRNAYDLTDQILVAGSKADQRSRIAAVFTVDEDRFQNWDGLIQRIILYAALPTSVRLKVTSELRLVYDATLTASLKKRKLTVLHNGYLLEPLGEDEATPARFYAQLTDAELRKTWMPGSLVYRVRTYEPKREQAYDPGMVRRIELLQRNLKYVGIPTFGALAKPGDLYVFRRVGSGPKLERVTFVHEFEADGDHRHLAYPYVDNAGPQISRVEYDIDHPTSSDGTIGSSVILPNHFVFRPRPGWKVESLLAPVRVESKKAHYPLARDYPRMRIVNDFETPAELVEYYVKRRLAGAYWPGTPRAEREVLFEADVADKARTNVDGITFVHDYHMGRTEPLKGSASDRRVYVVFVGAATSDVFGSRGLPHPRTVVTCAYDVHHGDHGWKITGLLCPNTHLIQTRHFRTRVRTELGAQDYSALGAEETDPGRKKEYLDRAVSMDPTEKVAQYNLACFYSLKNDSDRALEHLELALKNGYLEFEHMAEDSDLDPIRKLPAFKALMKRYRTEGD